MSGTTTTKMSALRQASGPPMEALPPTAHLLEPVVQRALGQPEWPVAASRHGDQFVDITANDFYRRIRQLAKGLIGCGLNVGDRVALMSHSRLEWMLVDYAILAAGGVTVPVYETSSREQMQWILDDSGSVAVIVETAEMDATFAAIRHATPTCRASFVVDADGLVELVRLGDQIDDSVLDTRIAELTTDRLATIIYTSGTTGRPKGCALTHANLRTNVRQNLNAVESMLEAHEVSLLFLPLAHVLTKSIALVGVEWGMKLAFATDVAHLEEELAMVRPTVVLAVPRVFEKIFNGAQHKAHSEGHGAIFDEAAEIAIRWSRHHAASHHRPITDLEHAALDHLVLRRVQAVFGSRVRLAFSGGGPLGERLTHFFNGVGVRIFEGYGLTETSPTLTLNRASAWNPGTVGTPVAGTSIRIGDDGEIMAAGPQVFGGYWQDLSASEEVFDDAGWFKTGDIGTLDENGSLRITGRKKELIVTAGGKNVAPAPLEDRLRAHPLISQAIVVGDTRPFIAAMVTLDEDALGVWMRDRFAEEIPIAELISGPELRAVIQSAINDANASVSRAESIRKFAILPHDLTIDNGELTPTLKVRRAIVVGRYAEIIDDLYG
jgi:long-chain acyl-CoA synthetase